MDLNRLIEEVLGMAKASMGQRVTEAEKNRSSERERERLRSETDLEKQRLVNTGALATQGMVGTQNLALERLKGGNLIRHQEASDTGAMARQRLIGSSAVDVANIGLTGEKYKADRLIDAYQGRASDPGKILEEWVKSNAITDVDQILNMRRKLYAQNVTQPPTSEDVGKFDVTDSSKRVQLPMTPISPESSVAPSVPALRTSVLPKPEPEQPSFRPMGSVRNQSWTQGQTELTPIAKGIRDMARRKSDLEPPPTATLRETKQAEWRKQAFGNLFNNPWKQ